MKTTKHTLLTTLLALAAVTTTAQVPERSTDIMLQAFYYQSYNDKGYGNTKWQTLLADTTTIGTWFDLVWLPPSASSSDDLGYHPAQYSNQSSNKYGLKYHLNQLIAALHRHDTRVIADIVINHAGNRSSWCDYHQQNFGTYGTYNPNATWITANDEVWNAGQSSCNKSTNAHADDGYGSEANYPYARDWDHQNADVQAMFRAYLQWMRTEMKYDGWRYDYCKGYHTSHINDYNQASQPYLSVLEYWDGNAATLRTRLAEAQYNTMVFDFAGKYTIYNQGIATGNYTNCRSNGLRALGLTRYAVTFIDNHDTHNRNDGNEYTGNNSISRNPDKILQANAYMLSMPGIPCVFYPHWITFQKEIAAMIWTRKKVGIHSQSTVTDEEAGAGYYRATIQGLYGTIKLRLGPNSNYTTCPEGYKCAASGTDYAIYFQCLNDAVHNTPQPLTGIYTQGHTLHIEGHQGQTCTIFTTTGQQLNTFTITDYHHTCQLPHTGIYILHINNQTTKITTK